jgi:hypothetical protein
VNDATLKSQLAAPPPDGATVALYRTRVYRFSDDPRLYVLAEVLEERYARGIPPAPATLDFLKASLDQIRSTGQPLPFPQQIAESEGIDVQQAPDARVPYAPRPLPHHAPRTIVFIVGAPRSGTSHLYNLLAYTGRYAYFTTASCWAWPVHNLRHPARRSFETLTEDVLAVDNKNTRLISGLVMPYESEDLYARAIPTYRHLGGHTYDLHDAGVGDPELLTANIQAHCRHFARTTFLTKSPFNSLRIPQLDANTGHRALFLHITRDQASTANSMRRNRFRFHHNGTALTEEAAWDLFTSTITRHAPPARTLTVQHRDLLTGQQAELEQVNRWLITGVCQTSSSVP